jgi:DNA-binding transcriptional regulator YiaG
MASMSGGEMRKIRLDAGLSRKAFGAVIGVVESTITRWENGDRAIDRATENHVRLLVEVGRIARPAPLRASA